MSASSTLVAALRLLLLGLLLASFVLKPALAFAEEVHELTAHAAAGVQSHEHGPGIHDGAPAPDHAAPAGTPDGGAPHDDDHWHLSHCCGHQAAVLPRMQLDLPAGVSASPVTMRSVAFAPTRLTAPFRPPITA